MNPSSKGHGALAQRTELRGLARWSGVRILHAPLEETKMGTGPPVCMFCMKIMTYRPLEFEKWECEDCGKTPKQRGVKHLFALTDEELQDMDVRWDTKEYQRRLEYRKNIQK